MGQRVRQKARQIASINICSMSSGAIRKHSMSMPITLVLEMR